MRSRTGKQVTENYLAAGGKTATPTTRGDLRRRRQPRRQRWWQSCCTAPACDRPVGTSRTHVDYGFANATGTKVGTLVSRNTSLVAPKKRKRQRRRPRRRPTPSLSASRRRGTGEGRRCRGGTLVVLRAGPDRAVVTNRQVAGSSQRSFAASTPGRRVTLLAMRFNGVLVPRR